jgi:hypothetical protein
MSTCHDRRCAAAAHVTARQARDASKYSSVAPDHALPCIESVGTLCYLSRLVCGLPTFYSGDFLPPPNFQKIMGITLTPTSNGVASASTVVSPWSP